LSDVLVEIHPDLFFAWKAEKEGCALPHCAFQPDSSAVKFDDSSDDGKPDACSVNLRIEAIEQAEDAVVVLWVNADAVIAHIERDHSILRLAVLSDFDHRILLFAHEFGGVFDQVLKDLEEALAIAM
jgi:hypothetical protein